MAIETQGQPIAGRNASRRGSNLTNEDRSRGGQRSAKMQQRDQFGHFIGSGKKERNADGGETRSKG
jgi:hypothetical protein